MFYLSALYPAALPDIKPMLSQCWASVVDILLLVIVYILNHCLFALLTHGPGDDAEVCIDAISLI